MAEKLKRAKQLMDITSTKEFDNYANSLREGGYINEGVDSDGMPSFDTPDFGYESDVDDRILKPITEENYRNSKLPKAILEDLKNNPIEIDENILLDNRINQLVDTVASQQKSAKPKPPTHIINEQRQGSTQATVSNAVDYTIIKDIVEGVVKRYTSALKKQLLSESASKSADNSPSLKGIVLGDSFQFVDSEGNIYEAQLKYKNTIKKKRQ